MFRWISIYIIVFLFVIAVSLHGISFVYGSGQEEITNTEREFHFRYHNDSDDLHFFGSNKWAVRYDFSEVYPSFDNVQFQIERALLYFPQIGDSIRIELFSDLLGQPSTQLSMVSAVVNQNLMDVPFPQPILAEKVWLIVTYTTSFNGPFISASLGGGSRSYYLNTNVTVPFYRSMANAGFQCEFLFGLIGDFVMDEFDLQLRSFDFNGIMQPDRQVYPEFTVYNHSGLSVDQAQIEINLGIPDGSYTHSSIIQIPSIPPFSEYRVELSDPDYDLLPILLPSNPVQMRLEAILSSEHTQIDTLHNNTIVRYLNIFSEVFPTLLVENFLQQSGSTMIWDAQADIIPAPFSILEYFPRVSDSLGVVGATQRFNWYSLNTMPVSIVNGLLPIYGYGIQYSDQLLDRINAASAARTFISGHECRFTIPDLGDLILATITLTNASTDLYTTTADFNLISTSRFFVGLFRKVPYDGGIRYVLERWISFAEMIDASLTAGESMDRSYTITLNNMPLDEFTRQYVLFYWIQRNSTREILFSAMADFSEIVPIGDIPLVPLSELAISPNPMYQGQSLSLKLRSAEPIVSNTIVLYNIRGQRILTVEDRSNELSHKGINIAQDNFSVSGIYFIRVHSHISDGSIRSTTSKISIIK